MQSLVKTVAFRGIDTLDVSVQVQLSNGLPAMAIVGLADKAVAESRERVRAALHALGLSLPPKRISVNLAPADVVKEGAHFDLPIAMGLLLAMGVLPSDALDSALVLGELSLDGSIQPVSGVLPAAVCAAATGRTLICPEANGAEAAWAGLPEIWAAGSLTQLINHLRGSQVLSPPEPQKLTTPVVSADLAELRGQETAKRVMEIAAAGGHHLLMVGPPGAGKSMLAARLPGLLPPLTAQEALDVTMIHSVAGQVPENGLVQTRPFRDPHHSASMAALVGGGPKARPGEISLAHHGVLFLDELAEFNRVALDSLRQPLETGEVVIARANNHIRYPARFQLIAAMNPCRCGYLSDPARACPRAPHCARQYSARISGPMLDRFDLILDVAELTPHDMMDGPKGETSAQVRSRVIVARNRAIKRAGETGCSHINARLSPKELEPSSLLSKEALALMEESLASYRFSARAFHRILRVACTIRDLENARSGHQDNADTQVSRTQLAEALHYRTQAILV